MNGSESEYLVEKTLTGLMEGFVPQPVGPSPLLRPDFRARIGDRDVIIKVKAASLSVVEDVLARFSLGALQARCSAAAFGALPMVAVVVPALGKKVERAVVAFMAEHAPDVGWALVDRAGNARVVVTALGLDLERRFARVDKSQPGRVSVRLFSDLNRWLLKVLLLAEVSDKLWGGPRWPILSGHDLGQAAGVSPEMVRRFLNAFEQQDLLRQTPQGLHLVRRSALLDLWRADEALDVRPGIPVRQVVGSGSAPAQDQLGSSFGDTTAIAGFEACRLLGVLHATVPRPTEAHALVPIGEIMERFGFEECTSYDAEMRLIPTRYPKSIQRGAVRHGGMLVVDAFQASLDVLRHPARGQEQSEYLLKEVLRLEGGE